MRFIAGGTTLLDLMKLNVETPGAARRHQPVAARQDRSDARRRTEDRRHRPQFRSRPPSRPCSGITPCCRRPFSPARRPSFATWRRRPATCCSGRAACTSATRPCPATSASPAPAARRSPAATARSRSSARASIASRPTRRTCAWRWRRWKRRSTCRARRARAPIPIGDFHLLPGNTPRARNGARAGRPDHARHAAAARRGEQAGLFEAARPGVVRVRPGVGRRRAHGRRRESDAGAHRARRRRHQAVAIARGRGRARRPARDRRRTSARRRRRPCATPNRRARTDSRSSWPSAASRTPCKRRRRPDVTEERSCRRHKKRPPTFTDRPRHAARGRPAEGERQGAVHLRLPLSRACSTRCRSRRRSPTAAWSSSTRPRPRRCPACARSFIARTSARSSARSSGPGFDGICDERRPPFEDDVIRYYGQYIALAVADTFETAKAAADAVRATYAKEKPNVDTDLEADDDPDVVATTFGPTHRLQSQRGDAEAAFAERAGQARPDLRHARRDAQPDRAARDDRDLGRLDVDALRVVAGRRQPPGRARADVRLAEGERPRHHEVRRLGFRQQAVALDALSARRRGGAAARQAGEARRQPQDDVPDRRSSARAPSSACGSAPRPTGKLVSLQHDYVYTHVDARRPPRRLRRGDGVPVQRAESARDLRPRQAQHRRRRPTCAARAPCPGSTRPSRR